MSNTLCINPFHLLRKNIIRNVLSFYIPLHLMIVLPPSSFPPFHQHRSAFYVKPVTMICFMDDMVEARRSSGTIRLIVTRNDLFSEELADARVKKNG